jgi:glucose-1-phosphate cytidylyltransferase
MKTVILCGGRGTRLGEHGVNVPKALIEIGGRPLLWHLLKIYSQQNLNDFVLCLGYLGDAIKRYFLDYYALQGNMTVALRDGGVKVHERDAENWKVHLIDTGLSVMTGGRVKGSFLPNQK